MAKQSVQRFLGPWIGETQGCEMPAHVWTIREHGSSDAHVRIDNSWEDNPDAAPFWAELLEFSGVHGFQIQGYVHGSGLALMIDAHHFVILGWDTNDTRGGKGPAYDVVFSRPGVAELNAREVWRRFCLHPAYQAAHALFMRENPHDLAKRK